MNETVQAVCRRLGVVRPESTILCRELGIDPDMPVETVKRRLLWGERVEQCGQYQTESDLIRYEEDGKERTTRVAWRLYLWLVRPDSPPSSVPSCQTCGGRGTVTGAVDEVRCPICGGIGEETP